MKSLPPFLLSIALLLCSCSKENPTKKEAARDTAIVVGQTYDEVERLKGKPAAIERGIARLKPEYELSDAFVNDPKLLTKKNTWGYSRSVEKVGQLIYVTWTYLDIRVDTFYVYRRKFQDAKENSYSVEASYEINGRPVSESNFVRFRDGDSAFYYDYNRTFLGKRDWEASMDLYNRKITKFLPGPLVTVKKKMTLTKTPHVSYRKVPAGIGQTGYKVYGVFAVTFDASSGRVVTSGYQPVSIAEILDSLKTPVAQVSPR